MPNLSLLQRLQSHLNLLSLPLELLLEIISYLSESTIAIPFYLDPHSYPPDESEDDCQRYHFPLPHDEKLMQRFDNLKNLSQTCRILRELAIPKLWKSLDIVKPSAYHWEDRLDGDTCQLAMSRYTSHVIDFALHSEDNLVDYIKTINIVLVTPETETIYTKFARFLRRLPNLSTLQILHVYEEHANDLAHAFSFIPHLPNLRTLSLPRWVSPILQATPNIKALFCDIKNWQCSVGSNNEDLVFCGLFRILQAVKVYCPHIEEFGVSQPLFEIISRDDSDSDFDDLSVTNAIIKAMPNLRTFPMMYLNPLTLEHTFRLSTLKHLQKVDVRLDTNFNNPTAFLIEYTQILFTSKVHGGKRIIRSSTDPRLIPMVMVAVLDLDSPKPSPTQLPLVLKELVENDVKKFHEVLLR